MVVTDVIIATARLSRVVYVARSKAWNGRKAKAECRSVRTLCGRSLDEGDTKQC